MLRENPENQKFLDPSTMENIVSCLPISDKLKYSIKTLGYLEPYQQTHITRKDLIKILEGKVRNPHAIKGFSDTDYAYFIICNNNLQELQERKERQFKSGVIDTLFYKSQWFGQFTVESESSIIIPNKTEINFNPFESRAIVSKRNTPAWSSEGFYQYDKNLGERILTSDIPLTEMLELVKEKIVTIQNFLK